MTIVVTTASRLGITVVGDRAITRPESNGPQIFHGKKVWYSPAANVALAFWGNVYYPGTSLEEWAGQFTASIKTSETVFSIAQRLADNMNAALEPTGRLWSDLRRGVHVSGYENALPVILHVHTGDPKIVNHELRVHRDFPDIHGGGPENYRLNLDAGARVQLRNGAHELFVTVAILAEESRPQLSLFLRTPVPAPTLSGQASFDAAIVRFAAEIITSSNLPPTVSTELDVVAFTDAGLDREACAQPCNAPERQQPPSAPVAAR
jgi:hypothetical protein